MWDAMLPSLEQSVSELVLKACAIARSKWEAQISLGGRFLKFQEAAERKPGPLFLQTQDDSLHED